MIRWKVMRCALRELEDSLNKISGEGWFVWQKVDINWGTTYSEPHCVIILYKNEDMDTNEVNT